MRGSSRATPLVKLSFSHAGARREPCRTLSSEELAALRAKHAFGRRLPARARAGHRRARNRRRSPSTARLLPASGLANDGPSSVYERFVVPAGRSRDFGSACAIRRASMASTTSTPPPSGSPPVRASSSIFGRSWAASGFCRPRISPIRALCPHQSGGGRGDGGRFASVAPNRRGIRGGPCRRLRRGGRANAAGKFGGGSTPHRRGRQACVGACHRCSAASCVEK